MFQRNRAFESEKLQLQELNQRLGHYLSRSKLLEDENARLVAEINALRQSRCEERDSKHMSELRKMRRLVEQISLEKCKAEMERETLRKELQLLQAVRSDESSFSRSVGGELKACEKQLRVDLQTNTALEQRLCQLQGEYARLEDAHRSAVVQLTGQARSRLLPVVTQTYRGPPALSAKEVQEYAWSLSEGWMDTFDMYRQQVEAIEESVRADQRRLEDIGRQKMEYAAQLNQLRGQIEQHSQIQMKLEDQLVCMHEKLRGDVSQYQIIIEELERERMCLANCISEKLKDHQDLLKVKLGLGLEVATYRALLEGQGKHGQMKSGQLSRERIIDIKMPSHPYTPRVSTTTAIHPEVKRHVIGYSTRNTEPISSFKTYTASSQLDSRGTSRILPIKSSTSSPAERRDMVAFTKAKQSMVKPGAERLTVSTREDTEEVIQRKTVTKKSQEPSGTLVCSSEKDKENKPVTTATPLVMQSVRVVSPPMMSLNTNEEAHQTKVGNKMENVSERKETSKSETKVSPEEASRGDKSDSENVETKVFASGEKILDFVSFEDIFEKVVKPAGLDTKLSPSADSKVTYHVEKIQQEDGSTKTEIILESKVEENVDVSDSEALQELLSKGVQKVSLEDIKGTPTESMIQNLLRLGFQGENLENRSVKVEVIETPVETLGDEEDDEVAEANSKPYFQPSSVVYQIEDLENEPQRSTQQEDTDEPTASTGRGRDVGSGFVHVQEVSKEESIPYYSQNLETQEYFVSTPEDMSGSEEGGGFMSCGHYGVVDDLSDERYYQEEGFPISKSYSDEEDSNRESPEYVIREGHPECIIEEEVHVSPMMQESMLEILKEESLDPRGQLKEALEQLGGTMSGALKEELAFFTKASEGSDNLSLNIKRVEQATDNKTTTIVAELNVSQTLEESGLLDDDADDLSQEQLLALLRSSNSGLHQAQSAEGGSGFTINISKEEIQTEGSPWITSLEEAKDLGELSKTEKVISLGPNERSFTFQMDFNDRSSATSRGEEDAQNQRGDEDNVSQILQAQMTDPAFKVHAEKRIATVYLESPEQD